MKVTKLLPLVLIAPLLASCGGSRVEDPKYEKYSTETNYHSFAEDFMKQAIPASATCFFFKDGDLPSMEGSIKQASETIKTADRNGKEVFYSNKYTGIDGEAKYDAAKLIIDTESTQESTEIESIASGTSSKEGKQSYHTKYQQNEIDSVLYTVMVNETVGEWAEMAPAATYPVSKHARSIFQSFAAIGSLIDFDEYETLSEEEKARYHFYRDETVFTIIYEGEWDEGEYIKDSADKVLASAHLKEESKYQVIFKEDSFRIMSSQKKEVSINCLEAFEDSSHDEHAKGDTYKIQSHNAAEVEVKKAEVDLAATDISNMPEGGY